MKDLRFSLVASIFWRRAYPHGRVALATNGAKLLPKGISDYLEVITFDFEKMPSALARTCFMMNYVASTHFDMPTIFAGHDVLFLKKLPELAEKIVTNYRYHPSQPYCSDFLGVRDQVSGVEFLKDLFDVQRWMPRAILDGASDQLAYTVVLGMPEKCRFNGAPFHTPRRPEVLALPASEYLFTPNDYFPSRYSEFGGRTESPSYDSLMLEKTALHFKGNRKDAFFDFANWAYRNGYVDLGFEKLKKYSRDFVV